jgi:hypothetical protein
MMKFRLHREYGALNSPEIFNAVEKGLKRIGHTIVANDAEVAVIWSALWHGRMAGNQQIFESRKKSGLPTLFIEIGNLKRGQTWRISVDHINGQGLFGNKTDLDSGRAEKLGLTLKNYQENRRPEILIACQHTRSLQWSGMPNMEQWVLETAKRIKQYSDRPILVRPHPRCLFRVQSSLVKMESPKKLPNTYDDFDIDYGYHCVINHNSGPAVQAAMHGIPVVTDQSSLAAPVSMKLDQIESPSLPNRTQWFNELIHTEWTVSEIEHGIPFLRLEQELKKYF